MMKATRLDGAIPGEALLLVFHRMELLERTRSVPLVCKRWAALAASPALLRSLSLSLSGPRTLNLARSFRQWLERHSPASGGRVQELVLAVRPWYHWDRASGAEVATGGVGVSTVFMSTEDAQQVLVELFLGITACGKGGSLQVLRLSSHDMPNFHLPASVVRAVHTLRHLSISCKQSRLTVATPLAPLAALQELELEAAPLRIRGTSAILLRLPALTSLTLGGLGAGGLPQQVTSLSQLKRLQLEGLGCGTEGYRLLSRLGSLEHLGLEHCLSLPPPDAVRPLSRLRSLHLAGLRSQQQRGGGSSSGSVEAAANSLLRAAPQLAELSISSSAPAGSSGGTAGVVLPAQGLSGLSRLERLCWQGPEGEGGSALPAEGLRLPEGPWLASLRRLLAPPASLAASLDALLAGAAQLERLALPGLDHGNPQHHDLLRQLTELPALRRVYTDAPAAAIEGGFQRTLQEAVRGAGGRRPLALFALPRTQLSSAVLSKEACGPTD